VSIRSFLDDPNPEHGLNTEALELFRRDKAAYHAQVRRHIEQYAKKK
jgi:ubiquitin-protein ligase